ncbi:general substrate transporter [Aspergillus granulosus]|uniref:General substrate transporter n=1 Tax=Aspergillus granulosus TaxID=176169 RepID=A0ABR4HF68_9EURO
MTMTSALPNLNVNTYNLWVVILVAVGTISTAYGLAVIGSTVGQPNFYTYFTLESDPTQPGYKHTTNIIGALNGINSAGAFIGCITQAYSADVYGRKATISLGSAVLILGGALCAGAVHMAMFLVGRCIAGFGAGTLACIVPIYQAEVSTAATRGAMVCVTGVMYAVGYSLAGWLGYGCWFMDATDPAASFAWRFPLAFQVVFPLCVLAGIPFIPESPRWLLAHGRREDAHRVVTRLHGHPSSGPHIASDEFTQMETQVRLDTSLSRKGLGLDLFSTPANRRRSLIAITLMVGNQFLGSFVLANYGVLIYASLGLTGSIPLLLNACWTSFTLIGNTWTALYVDRFGRRRFLLIGATGCTISIIFLCALTAEYLDTTNTPALRVAVFFIFFYIFFWSFFVDATQFAYISEIFPNHLRSQGVALGLGCFYLSSEVTLVAAPVALDEIGWRFYLVLIVPSSIYIAVIWFVFPETKGMTLEEMGRIFGDHVDIAAAGFERSSSEEEEKRGTKRENKKVERHPMEERVEHIA